MQNASILEGKFLRIWHWGKDMPKLNSSQEFLLFLLTELWSWFGRVQGNGRELRISNYIEAELSWVCRKPSLVDFVVLMISLNVLNFILHLWCGWGG